MFGETVEHEFGGAWTELKLDAVEYYLRFYTRALHDKPNPDRPFTLWYVDAFAGTGRRTATRETGGILEGRPVELERVELAGSALRALAVEPPFQKFIFVERDPERCRALTVIQEAAPGRLIQCWSADANEALPAIFDLDVWRAAGGNRAVVFLDPYALSVEWPTLQHLAATEAVDLWYLFPMAGVLRQLPRDYAALDAHKAAALDRIFGTAEWRTRLYSSAPQKGLFGGDQGLRRHASKAEIEAYARERLLTLFPYVSEPLPLLTLKGAQLFSLFLAVANPSQAAIRPARNCLASLRRKFAGAPGVHRRSGR